MINGATRDKDSERPKVDGSTFAARQAESA
jgi:hypothetical protein